ncbi:MAG: DUF2852 domain-containing protein, partial [Stellaceae bacterium]
MPIFALPFIATLVFARFAWVALIVLGFMVWWPLGLGVLAFTLGSGRMGCGHHGGYGRWEHGSEAWQHGHDRWQHKMERMQRKMDWLRGKMSGAGPSGGFTGGSWNRTSSSGNHAFDEYRSETLKRLEDEQHEFRE